MKTLRIYIDTSVIGGCLDHTFSKESEMLFQMAERGEIELLISDLFLAELQRAPKEVKERFNVLPEKILETVNSSPESELLRDHYINDQIVSVKSINDAHHVAIATVSKADVIVSWNFQHIVHLSKIRRFNAVNIREGYQSIEIRSPREVV